MSATWTRTRTRIGSRPLFSHLAAAAVALGTGTAQQAAARTGRYLQDYDYIVATVSDVAAAPAAKGIDWQREARALRPRFASCTDDVTHIQNCQELLALLRDGHTGILRHGVDASALPAKFDGLDGAGMKIDWDRGLGVVRGVTTEHPNAVHAAPGDLLLEIAGLPAWLAMERQKRRIERFQGQSSEHFLFATLATRFLPFGAAAQLECILWRDPQGARKVALARGGAVWSGVDAAGPEGLTRAAGVASASLAEPWGRIGYVRILGKMDAATVAACHQALDDLHGIDGLVLDCRGMGGGGDDPAWELAGRFFPAGVANGVHGRIEPSGSWQFEGPVVMLQDSLEASSAETFTWAMSETGRVLSVGRRTAGMAIIPRRYEAPSGLLEFRVGVTDRATPIGGIKTEGKGFPPDLEIRVGPGLGARPRAELDVALAFLRAQRAGVSLAQAKDLAARLGSGDLRGCEVAVRRLLAPSEAAPLVALAALFRDDLEMRLRVELALLEDAQLPVPRIDGSAARLAELEPVATAAGFGSSCARWRKALRALTAEGEAQAALLRLLDADFRPGDPKAAAAFMKQHGRTRTARAAEQQLLEPAPR